MAPRPHKAIVYTISEAKAQLSALVERALKGEVIELGRGRKPEVRLVRNEEKKRRRIPGVLKGQIKIAPDFNELSEDIARVFGMVKEL